MLTWTHTHWKVSFMNNVLFYRRKSQVHCDLCLHLRKEALCVGGLSKFDYLNVANRTEAAHFQDLYNSLISIIVGSKNQITATLGSIVLRIIRKSEYFKWTSRNIFLKKLRYYALQSQVMASITFKKQGERCWHS